MQYPIEWLTYVAAPTITALVSWFISRKRYRVDNKTVEIENNEKLLAHYNKEIVGLTERIQLYREENRKSEALFLEREQTLMAALREAKNGLREANAKIDHILVWFCCRAACKDRIRDENNI